MDKSAYNHGFVDACIARKVDPMELIKLAKDEEPKADAKPAAKSRPQNTALKVILAIMGAGLAAGPGVYAGSMTGTAAGAGASMLAKKRSTKGKLIMGGMGGGAALGGLAGATLGGMAGYNLPDWFAGVHGNA